MPFTISEATAINTLLDYVLGKDPRCLASAAIPPHTPEEARKAAELLAGKANRALMAGWNADRVRECWALPGHSTMHSLVSAVEGLLAEMGVTEPGAARRNGDIEEPAAILFDHLYDCWNQVMREVNNVPDAVMYPEGRP